MKMACEAPRAAGHILSGHTFLFSSLFFLAIPPARHYATEAPRLVCFFAKVVYSDLCVERERNILWHPQSRLQAHTSRRQLVRYNTITRTRERDITLSHSTQRKVTHARGHARAGGGLAHAPRASPVCTLGVMSASIPVSDHRVVAGGRGRSGTGAQRSAMGHMGSAHAARRGIRGDEASACALGFDGGMISSRRRRAGLSSAARAG